MDNIKTDVPINKLIDSVVTKNQKPENLEDGQLWATHSGVLKIGEIELHCHVLSNGVRIFEAEDIEKLFSL